MNDLNALNKMLTVKFELRIYWYTNKGQISNIANEFNDVSPAGPYCVIKQNVFIPACSLAGLCR